MKLKAPQKVQKLLQAIVEVHKDILGKNLVGIYLHGSLPMGSFNMATSDIDFLVVVRKPLNLKAKKTIFESLIELSKHAPAKGLEMSIVTIDSLRHFKHPALYELHFGKEHITKYQQGKLSLTGKRTDPDLASHYVKTLKRGYKLYGEPIAKVFPKVPEDVYWKSIMFDLEDLETGIIENPVYGILNLARTMKDAQEGTVSSKAEGGIWATKHLARQYRPLVKQALQVYRSKSQLKTKWNTKSLKSFFIYALAEIKRLNNNENQNLIR